MTPLEYELIKLNININNITAIIHDQSPHLCLGVEIDNNKSIFDLPIDISNERNNIVSDNIKKFTVHYLNNTYYQSLINVLDKRTMVFINKANTELIFQTDEIQLCISFFPLTDFFEYVASSFMDIKVEESFIDLDNEDYIFLEKGNITKISMLSKVFETKVPMINNITNEKFQEITGRTTAEIGLNIAIGKKNMIFICPNYKFYGPGEFMIAKEMEIIDLAIKYKIKKSRDII